jgi:dynactin 1
MTGLSPGTRILYLDGRPAVVRFAGNTHFAPGEWIGIELEDEGGKNDGSVQGQRYFECKPGHGMFVRRDAVTTEQPIPFTNGQSGKPNGIEARSRQSIMSAETARKRQSLMGSRATPGSRPSIRVRRFPERPCSDADRAHVVAHEVSNKVDTLS